jgi:hypothetical protein
MTENHPDGHASTSPHPATPAAGHGPFGRYDPDDPPAHAQRGNYPPSDLYPPRNAQPPLDDSSPMFNQAAGSGSRQWATPPRSNARLGMALLVLGGIWTALQVLLGLVVKHAQNQYFESVIDEAAPARFTTFHYASYAAATVTIAVWILGSLWLGVAYDNAAALSRSSLRRSKVWVWLGWWVPVVCLWFPKTIVDDAWDITSGRGPLSRKKKTGLWWGLWVSALVVTQVTAQIEGRAAWISDTVVTLERLLSFVMVFAFVAWVPMVRGLSAAQTELVRNPPAPG